MDRMPLPAAAEAMFRRGMAVKRQRSTDLEVAWRPSLHGAGVRIEVDRPLLPEARGRADVVAGPTCIADFIDGCSWHFSPIDARLPRAQIEGWAAQVGASRAWGSASDYGLAEGRRTLKRVREHDDPTEANGWTATSVGGRRPHLRASV